jgi:hypothetical protein
MAIQPRSLGVGEQQTNDERQLVANRLAGLWAGGPARLDDCRTHVCRARASVRCLLRCGAARPAPSPGGYDWTQVQGRVPWQTER